MNTSEPQENSTRQQSTGFARQAAKGSWASVAILFLLLGFGGRMGSRVVLDFTALALTIVGLSLGIIALFGVRKHGAKGILVPAVGGVIVNGLLVFIFVTNFMAARAKAQKNAGALAGFSPVESTSGDGNGDRRHKGEWVEFNYDKAYNLKINKETGVILLEHVDSSAVMKSLGQLVDEVETLKLYASALQQKWESLSYGGITQNEIEAIDGSARAGAIVRMKHEKPQLGQIHANIYILSNETNSISIFHYYPTAKESNAIRLFGPVMQSLKDGD